MELSTIMRAQHRWREILPLLGIDTTFLVNRHGPCPLCGGKDRFRFDDRDGSGSYYCSRCGAGTGVLMVRKKHGLNHKEACDKIDEIIGTDPAPRRPAPKPDRSNKREIAIRQLLHSATDGASLMNISDREVCL